MSQTPSLVAHPSTGMQWFTVWQLSMTQLYCWAKISTNALFSKPDLIKLDKATIKTNTQLKTILTWETVSASQMAAEVGQITSTIYPCLFWKLNAASSYCEKLLGPTFSTLMEYLAIRLQCPNNLQSLPSLTKKTQPREIMGRNSTASFTPDRLNYAS